MVDSEMPKSEGEFGKPASCWNLEYACPCPETDFCLTPRPRNSVRAVECGEDGSPALTSCLSESDHIGMLNYTIKTDPFCRKVTGPVWRRCANIARWAYWRVLVLETIESFHVKMAVMSMHII